MKLDKPVQVEVYPDHEDFAVRTLGMPGLGALGVTFGYVVAMDSPSGRKPGHLPLGQHHVARVEPRVRAHRDRAIACRAGSPKAWRCTKKPPSRRIGAIAWIPDVISAIKDKKLLPIADLDRGFIHPTIPGQVIVSYFQAGRICDYIEEKWGCDKLLAMMHDFGDGEDHRRRWSSKELEMKPEEFDKQFLAWRRSRDQEDRRRLRRVAQEPEGDGRQVAKPRSGTT